MKGAIAVRGLEHIGVFARDTRALARWYGETFGATEISKSDDDMPIIFLSFGGGALIELVPAPSPENRERSPDGRPDPAIPSDHVHLCLSVDDLDRAVSDLYDRGESLDREVFRAYDGSAVAFLRDPEGNLVQLVERVAGSIVHATVYDARG